MKVSVIIPVFNQLKLTIKCLSDLLNTYGVSYEVIVVDDCSSKEPVSKILPKLFPSVRVLTNPTNLGFAKSVNAGIRASTGDVICLLNNDIELPNPQWLKLLTDSLDTYDIVGPAGGRMDAQWNYLPGEATKNGEQFSFIAGWCTCFRREVVDKIGLMPENFDKGFFEDVLWCYRAKKAGLKLGITEKTQVKHLFHKTFVAEGYHLNAEYQAKRKIFLGIIRKE